MSSVQVQQSLVSHRKTLRLARLLSLDRYAVVGRLVALWAWRLDNAASDGRLNDDGAPAPRITEEIAAEIGVRARRYRMRFGASVPLNPMALAGNWTLLAHDIPTQQAAQQAAQQEGQRHGHTTGQFTRQAATGYAGYAGYRRGNGKPVLGTPEYYAEGERIRQAQRNAWGNGGTSGNDASHAGGSASTDRHAAALG